MSTNLADAAAFIVLVVTLLYIVNMMARSRRRTLNSIKELRLTHARLTDLFNSLTDKEREGRIGEDCFREMERIRKKEQELIRKL